MLRILTSTRRLLGVTVLGCAILLSPHGQSGGFGAACAETSAPSLKVRIAHYRKKLKAYKKARRAHEKRAGPYWRSISAKRAKRRRKRAKGQTITLKDYVLKQPPLYTGPPKPVNPEAKPGKGRGFPIVADFLRDAKRHFGFTPQAPASESAFKRAYAKAAAAAGFAKETCVKIYSFESGGNGRYDVQAGLEHDRPGAQAISTALGYNQLLTANTIGLLREHGGRFLAALRAKAGAASGARRAELEKKIAILAKMIRFTHSVRNNWYVHVRLGRTAKGQALHALNLDIDIGPLLQVQKLLNSINFAKRMGHRTPLSAAELEMMNLTGDGNGIDMVLMGQAMREKVPTANFFLQRGYERNPVAIRNNTVAKLLAATDTKMLNESKLRGAQELAAAFDAAR